MNFKNKQKVITTNDDWSILGTFRKKNYIYDVVRNFFFRQLIHIVTIDKHSEMQYNYQL